MNAKILIADDESDIVSIRQNQMHYCKGSSRYSYRHSHYCAGCGF